jgi:ketosteroid isomerase-like protein
MPFVWGIQMNSGFRTTILIGLASVGLSGCSTHRGLHGDPKTYAENAIRQADAAWSVVAEANNFEGFMSYYTIDARVLPPDAPIAIGQEAIRRTIRPFFAGNSVIRWEASQVEAARSGDMGYAQGTYTITLKEPKGRPPVEHGKYLEVWRRQSNGSWKCAVDMFSADQPSANP